jgi:hypothetical protein
MTNYLQGAYDLHIHTAPDVGPRKCTDLELARREKKAGLAGFVIKNHFAETAARAALLNIQYPDLQIAGGVVLNRSVGGFNPYAVEASSNLGGRFVWMPTLDSRSFQQFRHPDWPETALKNYLTVLDEEGRLRPQVHEVLEVAAEKDLIVATGHISAAEGLAVVAAAKEHRVRRVLITHADNPADCYTLAEQQECVRLGALIEHSYFTVARQRVTLAELIRQIKGVGVEQVILSTDFGQVDALNPDEGLAEFAQLLAAGGITAGELALMLKQNPGALLG